MRSPQVLRQAQHATCPALATGSPWSTLSLSKGAPPPATPTLEPAPTAPAPTTTATARAGSFIGEVEPSGELAFEHVEALAVDIGPRPAGSDAEIEAARHTGEQPPRPRHPGRGR